jgi:hypothetical protein
LPTIDRAEPAGRHAPDGAAKIIKSGNARAGDRRNSYIFQNYEQPKSGCQLITVGAKAPCLLGQLSLGLVLQT